MIDGLPSGGQLDRLDWPFPLLFAAACAERLFPGYQDHLAETHRDGGQVLRTALDAAWSAAVAAPDHVRLAALADAAEDLVPDEDLESGPLTAVAANAAAAVAYTLRCARSRSATDAELSSRQSREAAQWIDEQLAEGYIDVPDPTSAPVLTRELNAQHADLSTLVDGHDRSLVQLAGELRLRAEREAIDVTSLVYNRAVHLQSAALVRGLPSKDTP